MYIVFWSFWCCFCWQISTGTLAKLANSTNFANLGKGKTSGFSASVADFSSTNIDVALLIQAILGIQGVLFLFDYSYRAFQTVRLVSLFWKKSVVNLPKVDLRSDRAEITARWFTDIVYFFELLPFLYIQVLLVFMFVIIIVWAVAGMFVCTVCDLLYLCYLFLETTRYSLLVVNVALFKW